MKIADLISPVDYEGPDQIVRFVWYDCGDIVTVLTRDDRKKFTYPGARERWRKLRRAGWTKSETEPLAHDEPLARR